MTDHFFVCFVCFVVFLSSPTLRLAIQSREKSFADAIKRMLSEATASLKRWLTQDLTHFMKAGSLLYGVSPQTYGR
jgi:hypothetical protein